MNIINYFQPIVNIGNSSLPYPAIWRPLYNVEKKAFTRNSSISEKNGAIYSLIAGNSEHTSTLSKLDSNRLKIYTVVTINLAKGTYFPGRVEGKTAKKPPQALLTCDTTL